MALGCLLLIGSFSMATETKNAVGEKKEEMVSFLRSHLISVAKHSGKVHFVTDGKIWQKEIDLSKGEKLVSPPDHHASFFYEVKEIKKNSVVLKYETRFDHRSFGKDLITHDEGEFEITYGRI